MAIEVRIQNFQSIEDATLVVDGLTVVTGPNNSGKTAVMRAVGGVFTNPPAAPLVRHGAAYLSVTLTFDDGTTVTWEKGWEKSGQKGSKVNRYYLNGKELQSVGRGCPPEVEALGVRPISAGSEKIWPQVAKQFEGTLFLVNKSGALLAEALSDVERVGKLTKALRLSEKDRRAASSELKVRRKDVTALEVEVQKWDGLDQVEAAVEALAPLKASAEGTASDLSEARSLQQSLAAAQAEADKYGGFSYEEPDGQRVVKIQAVLGKVKTYRDRLSEASAELEALSGFSLPTFPDASDIQEQARKLEALRLLSDKKAQAEAAVAQFEGLPSVVFPDAAPVAEAKKALTDAQALNDCLQRAADDRAKADAEAEDNSKLLAEVEAEVTRLLGDRGFCPTCKTVHGGEEHRP